MYQKIIFLYFIIFTTSANCNSITPRIVGGVKTSIEEYPHHVTVLINKYFLCGGSILSKNIVITAAHCFDNRPNVFNKLYVRAGSSYPTRQGLVYKVKDTRIHPRYDLQSTDYDVALLKMTEPFDNSVNKNIKSIKLTDVNDIDELVGVQAMVLGMGLLKANGRAANELRKVYLPIMSYSDCNSTVNNEYLTRRMFCAGYKQGGKDACSKDSGGGLVVNNALTGIVSWGVGCADVNSPGAYTNLPLLKPWVLKTLTEMGSIPF